MWISHSVELGPVEAIACLSGGYNFSQYAEQYSPSLTAVLVDIGAAYDIAGTGIKITAVFSGQIAMDRQYTHEATWSVAVNYDFAIGGAEANKEEQ